MAGNESKTRPSRDSSLQPPALSLQPQPQACSPQPPASRPAGPQKPRKRPCLTEKCLNLEVVPPRPLPALSGHSSRALAFPLNTRDLLGRSSIPPGGTWRRPEAQNTTTFDRKMPQLGNPYPGLFQSSQASPALLRPRTQRNTSWNHLETPQKHRKRPDLTGK
jgi:hypothetical protein